MTPRLRLFSITNLALVVALAACDGKEANSDDDSADKAAASKPAEAKAPAKSVAIALDEGDNAIPATIEVPEGSTIFADEPTRLRVELGRAGETFGVQVQRGNEYNTDLESSAAGLAENKYGMTNEILEKTDTLLRYKMTSKSGDTSYKFDYITEIDGKKWVCTQGNYGGWSEAEAEAQLAACKTLRGK